MTELQGLIARAPSHVVQDFNHRLDVSWVYHDSVLEGQVYTMEELQAAIDDQVVSDSSLIPVYDEIRNHKLAVDLIRDYAERKRLGITLDVIKKIYTTLAPDDPENKAGPSYRKEMPLHRLYFHDLVPPAKISYRLRQLIQWLSSPDTKRSTHTVRLAAKAHHELLQIYPFPKHSGKVARLLMNLILLRQGYPPAIIHATERQRYYDALKASPDATAAIVSEALGSSVESAIHFFRAARQAQTA